MQSASLFQRRPRMSPQYHAGNNTGTTHKEGIHREGDRRLQAVADFLGRAFFPGGSKGCILFGSRESFSF